MCGENSPSSPPEPGADGPSGKTCHHCGEPIDTSQWYPVTNDRDADGSLRLYHFCSEGCQAAWLEESSD